VRTLEEVPEGATHWSKRELARQVGISLASVHRIWRGVRAAARADRGFQDLPGPAAHRQDPGRRRPGVPGEGLPRRRDHTRLSPVLARFLDTGMGLRAWALQRDGADGAQGWARAALAAPVRFRCVMASGCVVGRDVGKVCRVGIGEDQPAGWDFFISYTQVDQAWAEWIAWVLEEDGHSVLVQAWDFVSGSNWIQGMQTGVARAARTIAVLSPAYLHSQYGTSEWQAAWAADPAGSERKLLVMRVKDCHRPGFLAGVVSVDLFGTTEADARARMHAMVSSAISGRAKPAEAPVFPGRAVAREPRFPGDVEPTVARWPGDIPVLQWPMADHGEARAAFARLLCEAAPERALLVQGASETGKSHMSKQMIRNAMLLPGVMSGRFDFKGTTNMGVELEAFSQLLGIEPPAGQSLNERLAKIFTDLRRRAWPTLLVFDTYEAAGEANDWIEGVLLPYLVFALWLRVVIIGQFVPTRAGSIWESFAARPITLQLPGPEDWLAYGQANCDPTLELDFVARAHRYAGGKPSVLASLLGPGS